MKCAGVSSDSIFIRDAAGWMRCPRALKSWRPSGPWITISPSRTTRLAGNASSGK